MEDVKKELGFSGPGIYIAYCGIDQEVRHIRIDLAGGGWLPSSQSHLGLPPKPAEKTDIDAMAELMPLVVKWMWTQVR